MRGLGKKSLGIMTNAERLAIKNICQTEPRLLGKNNSNFCPKCGAGTICEYTDGKNDGDDYFDDYKEVCLVCEYRAFKTLLAGNIQQQYLHTQCPFCGESSETHL